MTYDERKITFTIDNSVNLFNLSVLQPYASIQSLGYNTLFQWGRKDPQPSGIRHDVTHTSTDIIAYPSSYKIRKDFPYTNSTTGSSGMQYALMESVRNPGSFLATGNLLHYAWFKYPNLNPEYVIGNLWDSNLRYTSEGIKTNTTSIKTVYDPCPPGYKVPMEEDFYVFRDHRFFYDNVYHEMKSETCAIKFPMSGFRWGFDGSFHISKADDTIFVGQYYSSLIANYQAAYHLCFKADGTKYSPHYENSRIGDAMSIRPVKE